jgi:hypothetical protein
MKTIPVSTNPIHRWPFQLALLLMPALLACLALPSVAKAVTPAPDGGYGGNNTAEGGDALFSLTSGVWNSAFGFRALYKNATGIRNTAIGYQALYNNTAKDNVAVGANALFSNTTGHGNTANGGSALKNNTEGFSNTADGFQALNSNTIGHENTAIGVQALYKNSTGSFNTATGASALMSNTIGIQNTATGVAALTSNTIGTYNTAMGNAALESNTDGNANTAYGPQALDNNTTGSQNTAIGPSALLSNSIGNRNIAVGVNAGELLTTGDNNIDIGSGVSGPAGEAKTIRIGDVQTATYIAGISGAAASSGVPVYVNSDGKLGTLTSSKRFKQNIQNMGDASHPLYALHPVIFRYKQTIDPKGTPQFGLVAEEVEKVNPDLVTRDAKGELYTVRYEAVNAMLLNEFLKEHRKVEEQEATITQLKKGMEILTARLEEQASQIQKVSAQIEATKSAPQIVLNN